MMSCRIWTGNSGFTVHLEVRGFVMEYIKGETASSLSATALNQSCSASPMWEKVWWRKGWTVCRSLFKQVGSSILLCKLEVDLYTSIHQTTACTYVNMQVPVRTEHLNKSIWINGWIHDLQVAVIHHWACVPAPLGTIGGILIFQWTDQCVRVDPTLCSFHRFNPMTFCPFRMFWYLPCLVRLDWTQVSWSHSGVVCLGSLPVRGRYIQVQTKKQPHWDPWCGLGPVPNELCDGLFMLSTWSDLHPA